MSFVYPSFLFALAVLAIPIIIHLFNFRKFKTIYFSNVRFLKEIKEETSSRSKLKHILTLIARMLALAFLVFAFAQPFIPKEDTHIIKGSRSVSVFVDNSFSMDAVGDELSLLEKAKSKAREVAEAYGAEDQFQLITNDFEGKHQRLVSKDEFLVFLDDVKVSPAVRTLEQVKERQLQALSTAENKLIYFISDFQDNITDLEEDTLAQYYLVPVQANQQRNIAIDSIWTAAPIQLIDQENRLYVRLINSGDEDVENSSLTLFINGQTKAIGDFSIPANGSVVDTISFTINGTGWNRGEIAINDYPITFDDNYYFTFYVPDQINMLVINRDAPNPYFTALSTQEYIQVENNPVTQVNYSELSKYQLIILDQVQEISSGLAGELRQFLENGGNILFYPAADANLTSYNSFLSSINAANYIQLREREQTISSINMEQGLFQDVFEDLPENILLPKVSRYYEISRQTRSNADMLLMLRDGNPFLSKYSYENGAVYLSAVPPDLSFSDLPKHTLFVISIIQIALSTEINDQLAYTIGRDENIQLTNTSQGTDNVLRIRNEQSEFIPRQRSIGNKVILSVGDQVEQAGIYEVFLPGSEQSRAIAFNYDRTESYLRPLNIEQLEQRFPGDKIEVIEPTKRSLGSVVAELNEGIRLWKLCIIFALVFLGIEVLLLRFFPSV